MIGRCFALVLLSALATLASSRGSFAAAEEAKDEKPAEKAAGDSRTAEEWKAEVAEIVKLLKSRYKRDVEAGKLRLAGISDPKAVTSLSSGMRYAKPEIQRLLMETCARCGGEAVARMLAYRAIRPRELSDEAALLLAKMDPKDKRGALSVIGHELKSSNTMFRALRLLEVTGLDAPPAEDERYDGELVLGLIKALKVEAQAVQLDAFGRRVSNRLPQPNPIAHKALQKYTGQALPLDQAAWLSWFHSLPAAKKKMPVQGRRMIAPVPDTEAEEGAYEVHTPEEWRKRLVELRYDLENQDKKVHKAAIDAIVNIRDPDALHPLRNMLSREVYEDYRCYWIVALGNVGGEESFDVLLKLAVGDEVLMRDVCAVVARMDHREKALPMMIKHLADPKHQVRAVQVLAAADLVQRPEKDEQINLDLVRWLIDALAIKSKKYFKQPFYYCYNRVSVGTRGSVSSGLVSGVVDVPVPVEIRTPNDLAHRLLQQYTGRDFPLDQRVWTRWYVEQRRLYHGADR